MTESLKEFHEKICKHLAIKLDLVINDNRCTMLRVLEKTRDRARLSLHRMFLEAPENVISAIAHYIRGTRRNPGHDRLIRGYIQTNLSRYDYSARINKSLLDPIGKVYDLKEMYYRLNEKYFSNRLDLKITWFGHGKMKRRTRVIFGLYVEQMKLIKIHRMMDNSFFPKFFVEFVVYHEMLHGIVPGYVDSSGFFRMHGDDFKMLEKQYHDYHIAMKWEKENKHLLFY